MDGLQTTSGILRAVARTVLDFRIHEQYKRSAKLWTIRISVNRKSSHKLEELIHTNSEGCGLDSEI